MSDDKPRMPTAEEFSAAVTTARYSPESRGALLVAGLTMLSGVTGYAIGRNEVNEVLELFWTLAVRLEDENREHPTARKVCAFCRLGNVPLVHGPLVSVCASCAQLAIDVLKEESKP